MSRLPKWRLTETAVMRLLIALIFVLVSCYVTRAQEPAATDTAEQALEAPVQPQSESVRAALRVLESQDPQTPAELLNAVDILRKLGATEEARTYLNRVTGQELDIAALSKIHEELGTIQLIPLANDTSLMPEARELVFTDRCRGCSGSLRAVNRDPSPWARRHEAGSTTSDPPLLRWPVRSNVGCG